MISYIIYSIGLFILTIAFIPIGVRSYRTNALLAMFLMVVGGAFIPYLLYKIISYFDYWNGFTWIHLIITLIIIGTLNNANRNGSAPAISVAVTTYLFGAISISSIIHVFIL